MIYFQSRKAKRSFNRLKQFKNFGYEIRRKKMIKNDFIHS